MDIVSEIESKQTEVVASEGSIPVFVARPTNYGPFPAVLLLMEQRGLTPHIKQVARGIASHGYVVVAPNLYHRLGSEIVFEQVDTACEQARRSLAEQVFLDEAATLLSYTKQRRDVLPNKIAVVGFDMGGGLSVLTACKLPGRAQCAVSIYGIDVEKYLGALDEIKVPLHLVFAGHGQFGGGAIFDRARALIPKDKHRCNDMFECHQYSELDAGFMDETSSAYNKEAAQLAAEKFLTFLAHHLNTVVYGN